MPMARRPSETNCTHSGGRWTIDRESIDFAPTESVWRSHHWMRHVDAPKNSRGVSLASMIGSRQARVLAALRVSHDPAGSLLKIQEEK